MQHKQHKSTADNLPTNVKNLVHPPLSFLQCYEEIGAFIVYSLSFNLANLNWPKEQSTYNRYLWLTLQNRVKS